MKKVATAQLISEFEFSTDDVGTPVSSKQIPISPETFHSGLKIPLASVQGIWQKAEELLRNTNSISPAPDCDNKSKMVISRSGKRPHVVACMKQGKCMCDSDCANWKSLKICSHSVAVAHVNNSLE